jgi:hypothetical protein
VRTFPDHFELVPIEGAQRFSVKIAFGREPIKAGSCQQRVKMRRTRISCPLYPPLATEERTFGIGSSVPEANRDAAHG